MNSPVHLSLTGSRFTVPVRPSHFLGITVAKLVLQSTEFSSIPGYATVYFLLPEDESETGGFFISNCLGVPKKGRVLHNSKSYGILEIDLGGLFIEAEVENGASYLLPIIHLERIENPNLPWPLPPAP